MLNEASEIVAKTSENMIRCSLASNFPRAKRTRSGKSACPISTWVKMPVLAKVHCEGLVIGAAPRKTLQVELTAYGFEAFKMRTQCFELSQQGVRLSQIQRRPFRLDVHFPAPVPMPCH